MGRKIRFTMAGDAWPDTIEPTHMPMAQNGSAPSTSITNSRTPCAKVSGTCADEHGEQHEHQRDDRDEQHGHGGARQQIGAGRLRQRLLEDQQPLFALDGERHAEAEQARPHGAEHAIGGERCTAPGALLPRMLPRKMPNSR